MTAPTALLSALAATTAARDTAGEVSTDAAQAFAALLTQAMPAPAPAPVVLPVGPAAGGASAGEADANSVEGQEPLTQSLPFPGTEAPAPAITVSDQGILTIAAAGTTPATGLAPMPAIPEAPIAAAPVPAGATVPQPAPDLSASLITEIAKLEREDATRAAAASRGKRPAPAAAQADPGNPAPTAPASQAATDTAATAGTPEAVRPESPRWGQMAARRLKHALHAIGPRPALTPPMAAPQANSTEALPAENAAVGDASEADDAEITTCAAPVANEGVSVTTPAVTAPLAVPAVPAPVSAEAEPAAPVTPAVPKPGTVFGASVRGETGEGGSPAIRAALLILDAIRTDQDPDAADGTSTSTSVPAEDPSGSKAMPAPAKSLPPVLPANARVVAAAVAALHADRERPEAPPRPSDPGARVEKPVAAFRQSPAARPAVNPPSAPAVTRPEADSAKPKPGPAAARNEADTPTKQARPDAAAPQAPAPAAEVASRTITTTADRGESSSRVTTDLPRPATETAPGPRGLRAAGHQVTIELDGNSADATRIRVTVHGNAVRATVLSGAEQSGRLSLHADELTRALEDRGFRSANVTVRTAGEGAVAVPGAGRSDSANGGPDDRPRQRGEFREPAPRDGQRRGATDDRPRQPRRPDPEEE